MTSTRALQAAEGAHLGLLDRKALKAILGTRVHVDPLAPQVRQDHPGHQENREYQVQKVPLAQREHRGYRALLVILDRRGFRESKATLENKDQLARKATQGLLAQLDRQLHS